MSVFVIIIKCEFIADCSNTIILKQTICFLSDARATSQMSVHQNQSCVVALYQSQLFYYRSLR